MHRTSTKKWRSEKYTKNPQCPLALLHNADWKLYSHPKKISCWVLLLTSPKKIEELYMSPQKGPFQKERIVFQSHHFLTRHVSFRGGYKFNKKNITIFHWSPLSGWVFWIPSRKLILYPTEREVRKRIDSKVPAGMGYASYHQSLKRKAFWGPPYSHDSPISESQLRQLPIALRDSGRSHRCFPRPPVGLDGVSSSRY